MKKTKALIIAFASLATTTLFLTVATFAWFTYNGNLSHLVNVDSSSLTISDVHTDVYKYVYHHFKDASGSDTSFIDYFDSGTVTKNPDSNAMNLFDPTYLIIADTKSQDGIYALNTNLVLAVSFTIHYSTPVDLEIYAKKNSDYTAASGHYGISRFLHYNVFSPSEESTEAAGTAYTSYSDDEKIFYSIKNLAQNAASNTTFAGASTAAILNAQVVSEQPSAATTLALSYFIAIDYDNALTSSTANDGLDFYDVAHIGNEYPLDMDYGFYLKATEHLGA
jgi:hypothetical protein